MTRGKLRPLAVWLSLYGCTLGWAGLAAAQSASVTGGGTPAASGSGSAGGGSSMGGSSMGGASSGDSSTGDSFSPLGVRDLGLGDGTPANPGIRNSSQGDFYPVPDRWRVGLPGDYVQNTRNDTLFDPYGQNVLKGDYPILDNDKFLILTLTSDTLFEARKLPMPSGISTARAGNQQFFGEGDQQLLREDFVESVEFFRGDAEYRPRDFEIRETGVFEYNYVHTGELQQINPDVRDGRDRNVSFFGFQELFVENKLADRRPEFRLPLRPRGHSGVQQRLPRLPFQRQRAGHQDFRKPDDNRIQYNLAGFYSWRRTRTPA